MSAADVLLLVVAGVGAGLTGSIAGLASLVSYPALLAVGLPPVSANVTNTVGLVFSSAGAVAGSRPELRGQGAHVRALAIAAVLGGSAGAGLLLLTPADSFERVVPVLIAGAGVAILRRPARRPGAGHVPGVVRTGGGLVAATFVIGVYGGYFGAAAGVLFLALLLAATHDTLPRSNALKNAVLGIANATAAIGFCVFGDVRWAAVLPLAAGLFAGARIGPIVVRRTDGTALRRIIGLAAIGLAIKLALDAY